MHLGAAITNKNEVASLLFHLTTLFQQLALWSVEWWYDTWIMN